MDIDPHFLWNLHCNHIRYDEWYNLRNESWYLTGWLDTGKIRFTCHAKLPDVPVDEDRPLYGQITQQKIEHAIKQKFLIHYLQDGVHFHFGVNDTLNESVDWQVEGF